MPIFNVEAPDGHIIKVEGPEGATEEQAIAYAQSIYTPQEKKERSWTEALVTDPLASLGSGIGSLAQLPGQIGQLAGIVGPQDTDTGLMGAGKQLQAFAESQKSEALKQKQAQLQQDIAKQEGFFNEAATAVKGTLTDPALLSSFLFEQVPNMVGGLGGGMVARGAVKTLLKDATETALEKAAVRGAVSTSAVQQGADVGSGTYQQTYDALIKKGVDPTQANEQALTAARESALGATVASLGAHFLVPGGQTVEQAFLGRGLPRTGGFVKGFMGEGASEAFEEGAGQFLSNLAQSQYVPETDLMKGVGSAAGLGGVLGGVMGGMGGVSLRGEPTGAPAPNAPPTEAAPELPQLEQKALGLPQYGEPGQMVTMPDGSYATPEQAQEFYRQQEQAQFKTRFDPEAQFARTRQEEAQRQELIAKAQEEAAARTGQVAQEEMAQPEVVKPAEVVPPAPVEQPRVELPQDIEQTELAPKQAEPVPISQKQIDEIAPVKTAKNWFDNNVVGKTVDEVRAMVDADPKLIEGKGSRATILNELIAQPKTEVVPVTETVAQPKLDAVVQQADQGNEQAKMMLRDAGATYTPEIQQAASKIHADLTPYLEKIGLGHVGLQLVNSINNGTADGAYFRNAIQIALDTKNPIGTLRHESIHALKELNVFTPAEWDYLSKEAGGKWVNEFISPEKQTQYRQQYVADNGSEQGFDSYLQEEAIAEAFRSHGDKPKAGALKRIVNKLKAFFEATGNWLRGNGFNSVDSIFSGIEAGRYAPTRAAGRTAMAPAYSLRDTLTEAFRKWFGSSKITDDNGDPQPMYHITKGDFSTFHPGGKEVLEGHPEGLSGTAIWFSPDRDYQPALHNVGAGEGKFREGTNVIPVYLKMERPLLLDDKDMLDWAQESFAGGSKDFPQIMLTKWKNELIKDGYDGVIFKGEEIGWGKGSDEYIVFEPNQIKSVFNKAPTAESADIRYSLKDNAPPSRTTKTAQVKTAGKAVSDTVHSVMDDANLGTKLRIKYADVSSGLANVLAKAGLARFDENGQLRADLLHHAKAQTINLIKNMMVTGLPMINADGTLGIRRSDKTLAAAQQMADKLNNNAFVKSSGLTGRDYVAEVALAKRAEEIQKDDKRRNAEGVKMLVEAKAKRAQAKKIAGGNPKEYHDLMMEAARLDKKGLKAEAKAVRKEARDKSRGNITVYKALLEEARKLSREGYQEKNLKREYRLTPEQLAWADKQIKNVPELNQIFDIWRENNHAAIDAQVGVGLLTKEKADEYKRHEHYIPLFKSAEDLDAEGLFARAGTGAKSVPKQKKLVKGTHDVNVWENVDKQMARMVAVAYENQTRRIAAEQLVGAEAAHEVNKSNPNVNLRFMRDGKEVSMIVEDPTVVAAFQSANYAVNPIFKSVIGSTTTALRYGALLNPMFWMRQIIRDPLHSTMVTQTTTTPFHSMKNFAEIVLGKETDAYRTLVEHGVIGEVGNTLSIDDYLKSVGKSSGKKETNIQKALHKLLQIHESSDAATRVGIYNDALKKAKAQGMSEEDAKNFAVMASRESINFAVQGNSPTLAYLRQMIPFLSASISSLDTVYRAATGYGLNAEEKRQVQRLFMTKAAIFSTFVLAYAMLYQDDDDYKKLPDNVKDNNFLIPMPSPTDPTKKVFIKVPTPFEIGFLLKTIPEASVRYAYGTSTGEELFKSLKDGFLHNVPGNGVPVPQIAKPILENVTNYSFYTGKPIESLGESRLPPEMRGQGSSEFAKQVGGALGYSPKKIDNLISGYFAEAGTSAAAIASSMIHAATGTEPPSTNFEEMWGIKSFVTNPNVNKAISDFYEINGQAQQTVAAFNEYKNTNDFKAIDSFLKDEENITKMAAAKSMSKIADSMGQIRAYLRMVENDQTISPQERRKIINELQQQQAQIAGIGVDIAKGMGIR